MTREFTAVEAKAAGLLSKDTYQKFLKDMLWWKTVHRCATALFPDVAAGIADASPAEISVMQTEKPSVVQISSGRQRDKLSSALNATENSKDAIDVDYITTGGTSGIPLRFFIGSDRSSIEYPYLLKIQKQRTKKQLSIIKTLAIIIIVKKN